ncbi:hypothetical protein J2741_000304 [Methanolinea mesophila]|uniref:DUF4367 domain-containing protein n=1 Tax=Methanolinea mesophila TaxID=547055 RepID=UPI001AE5FE1E|nr:DUF4367 domain-containing protein [Methanolinea mesophila]MBP1927757.1 hypothetical protein [Methanolinea mesophila]
MMKNPYFIILIPLVLCLIFLIVGWIASISATPKPDTSGGPQITPYRAETLNNAAEVYGPGYGIATSLPAGCTFHEANYYDGTLKRIDTIYSGSTRLTLTQQKGEQPFCVGGSAGKSVPVIINGGKGNFTQGEKTGNSLSWYDGNYSFCISGSVNQEEMTKIAESVRYSEENESMSLTQNKGEYLHSPPFPRSYRKP